MESLGYVTVPQCGCMEHEVEYITFYVQKHVAGLGGLFWSTACSQKAARGAHISETRLLYGLIPWVTASRKFHEYLQKYGICIRHSSFIDPISSRFLTPQAYQ